MESPPNCSPLGDCPTEGTNSSQKAWRLLQELCHITKTSADSSRISALLLGVLSTLLTCGLLLAIFFLAFTIRFKNNRIVKMSSPNLSVVTLLGSSLTYVSGYLFGIQEHNMASGTSIETLVQVRIGMLYLGVSLVFGPILGKSWRLYKVFTQRVPDKRVIIKDIQLLGMVAGLLFFDVILLLTWMLSDPVHCVQSLNAAIRVFPENDVLPPSVNRVTRLQWAALRTYFSYTWKSEVAEKDVSCSVNRVHFCTSLYSELWILLLFGFKGTVLIYGTYLAGLTDNVSSPPVNQSLTIMVGVNLVILSTGIVLLVTRFFYAWSNLVFGLTSGGIFLCTTTVNCFIFIPQLMQWRQFEEDHNQSIGQMAKFFNSPSRSFRSMYSEEKIYHLLGENNSMKRLLTEKDAVIESLQEQVSNAKDKLSRLMSVECGTQPSEMPPPSLTISALSHVTESRAEDPGSTVAAVGSWTRQTPIGDDGNSVGLDFNDHIVTQGTPSGFHQDYNIINFKENINIESPLNVEVEVTHRGPVALSRFPSRDDGKEQWVLASEGSSGFGDLPSIHQNPASLETNSLVIPGLLKTTAERKEQPSPKVNYVSSEKLQEILEELSVDAAGVWGLKSPERPRRASQGTPNKTNLRSSEHFRNVCLSLSPYMMRRRRGHAYSPKILSPLSYQLGPLPPHLLCMTNRRISRPCTGLKTQVEEELTPMSITVEGLDSEGHDRSQSLPPAFNRDLSLQTEDEHSSPENMGTTRPFGLTNVHHLPKRWRRSPTEHFPVHSQNETVHEAGENSTADDPRKRYTQDSIESDSSSSEEYFCCCHRPFCEVCFQNSYDSSDSGNSETDHDAFGNWEKMCASSQPVVNFKEDLRPTFV